MNHRRARVVIRAAAWLVPTHMRARWREEWLAELDASTADRLTWTRIGGAPWDALSTRWTTRLGKRQADGSSGPGWVIKALSRRQDVRYAIRRLCKQPLASTISIVTLACAIGAAAATWSLLSATLLNPLHLPNPNGLVQIGERSSSPRGPYTSTGITYPDYLALQRVAQMPLTASGALGGGLVVQASGDAVQRSVRFAAFDFLDLLGIRPSLGRFFTSEEDRPGGPLVAVLSDRLWRLEFQTDPSVLGRVIHIGGLPVTIIGITPRGFRGLELDSAPALFMPLHAIDRVEPYPNLFGDRPTVYWVEAVGRLPTGVTLRQMQARLSASRLSSRGTPITFVPTDLRTAAIRENARAGVHQFSLLLGATVALLLAIGILTVGMLLVLRTEARSGEFAACQALGASRARLAAGVALEGLMLAGAGALLAVPMSEIFFAGVRLFELPGGIRIELLDLSLDGRVLSAVTAAAMVAVLFITLLVTLFGVRREPVDVLRSHAGATPRLTRRNSRSALVTVQVAVALVLTSGAGLFGRSVMRALSLNPEVDITRLVTTSLNPTDSGYDLARGKVFFDALRSRLGHEPAVTALGTYEYARITMNPVLVDGQPRQEPPGPLWPTYIDEGYLRAMSLPVIAGRPFTANDRAGGPPVAVVNATLAKFVAGSASPLDHQIGTTDNLGIATATIVGVVPDFTWGVSDRPRPALYEPMAQEPLQPVYPGSGAGERNLVMRASGDVPAAMVALSTTVRSLDPKIHLKPMTTLETTVLNAVAPQRLGMTVMGALGAIALLLSVFGTYVLAESMSISRRREMGIRAALGAPRRRLQLLLLGETCRLVGTGLLLGFGLGWLGTGTIRAFLFEVQPFDPVVTGGVAALIIGFALLVSLRPAVVAARFDVARILHDE